MSQLCTATFITASGFATWLTPTVEVVEALTWTVVWTYTMTEVHTGNYIYNFATNTETVVYFFNYDAGSASVLNRYMGNNNKVDIGMTRTGGWMITYNKVITEKEITDIADKVSKALPKQKAIKLDTSKIEETLGTIVDKIDEKEIEFDYALILSDNKKNTQEIIKKVWWIIIPKQDDSKVLAAINNIPEPDLSCMDVMDKKVDWITAKFDWLDRIINIVSEESKAMETLKKVKAQLGIIENGIENTTSIATNDRLKEIDPEEIKGMMEEDLQNDEDFNSLVKEDGK